MIFQTKIHQELITAFENYMSEATKIEKGTFQAIKRARKELSNICKLAKNRRQELLEDFSIESV